MPCPGPFCPPSCFHCLQPFDLALSLSLSWWCALFWPAADGGMDQEETSSNPGLSPEIIDRPITAQWSWTTALCVCVCVCISILITAAMRLIVNLFGNIEYFVRSFACLLLFGVWRQHEIKISVQCVNVLDIKTLSRIPAERCRCNYKYLISLESALLFEQPGTA